MDRGVTICSLMISVPTCVAPRNIAIVWFALPFTAITPPLMRRFAIVELPETVSFGHPADVVADTTSAVITLLSTPTLMLLMLAVDWLSAGGGEPLPPGSLPVVVDVEEPTVATGARFT